MLEVRGLEKSFSKKPIVCGVDLDVGEGEIVGLLGTNGAGKTTTFRMIMGMLRPDKGTVSFLGQDLSSWPLFRRARAGMGYLPQETSVFRDLTTEQNLMVVLERLDYGRKERRQICDGLLEEYGIAHRRDVAAGRLSGGQKRRLEIARALVTQPKLLLLDEPFAGVDPIAVAEVREVVWGLREKGIAIFITDHNVEHVLRSADRVYVMHEGAVIVAGTPPEIVASPIARQTYLGHDFELNLDGAKSEA